jgi:hypothetical protein
LVPAQEVFDKLRASGAAGLTEKEVEGILYGDD